MGITPSINSHASMQIVEFRTRCPQTNQRYEDRKAVPRRIMGIVWSMAFHAVNITTPMVIPKKMLLSLMSSSVAGSATKFLGRKVTIIFPSARDDGNSQGVGDTRLDHGALSRICCSRRQITNPRSFDRFLRSTYCKVEATRRRHHESACGPKRITRACSTVWSRTLCACQSPPHSLFNGR
jgi:hypothetical protein